MTIHSDQPSMQMNLTHQLLLAMPGKVGGELANTVIYICEHSEHGALGLVINRPTDITVGDLLQRIELPLSLEIGPISDAPVYFGGPVQTDRGFVLHQPQRSYNSSIPLGHDVALTTSKDVLQDVAAGKAPDHVLITLGYAGWGAGQLEAEIASNAWLNVLASNEIIFDIPPEQRYEHALSQLGIDTSRLSGDAGHA